MSPTVSGTFFSSGDIESVRIAGVGGEAHPQNMVAKRIQLMSKNILFLQKLISNLLLRDINQ